MFLRRREDERGSMLIVALGILMLLTVLAVTFVSLMRLERAATVNYVDGVKARLIAEGGLEVAMAQLRISAGTDAYSDPDAGWVYANGNYWLPVEDALAIRKGDPGYAPPMEDRMASFAGLLAQSYNGGGDQYKIKVVDTQTQFNLNTTFEILDDGVDHSYVRFLDALGVAISQVNPNARKFAGTSAGAGRNPVFYARYPKGSPNALRGGAAIYAFRQAQEGKRFNSKEALLEVLETEEDYNLLKDYVTTISWTDPNTVSPRSIRLDADHLLKGNEKPWSDVVKGDPRSPININLASTEIIAANLAGIAGRAIFPYTGPYSTYDSRLAVIDDNTPFRFDRSKEEISYFGVTGVLVYLSPFGYHDPKQPDDEVSIDGALDFAFKIRCRLGHHEGCQGGHRCKTPDAGPFKSFSEWETFVDQELTNSYLLNSRDSDGRNVFPNHAQAQLFQLDHVPITNTTSPSQAEVTSHPRFIPFFYDAVRDMIKANASPNARLSSWNPDPADRLLVDKGGLLYLQDPTNPASNNVRGMTNEWCLSSKGIFEIISLGEILGPPPEDPSKGTQPQMFAQAKVRGVLQLYTNNIHTTQRDFEKNGFTYTNDRVAVASYPVPKIYWDPVAEKDSTDTEVQGWLNEGGDDKALHGSDLDGRLELATFRHFGGLNGAQDSRGFRTDLGEPTFELLLQDRRVVNPGSNLIAPADPLMADTSGGVANNSTPGLPPRGNDREIKNGWGWPYGTALQGVNYANPYSKSQTQQEAWRWDVLTPDGYLNSELRRSTLWYRASDKNSQARPADPTISEKLRGDSMAVVKRSNSQGQPTGGNVGATDKGAVEFWYKPDFDWSMEIYNSSTATPTGNLVPDDRICGFLATSHITQNPWGLQGDQSTWGSWSRGTQMYVTRTSQGELRISRLFFEVVGPTGDPQEEPMVLTPPAGNAKVKFTDYLNQGNGIWPPTELLSVVGSKYELIKHARMDYWVPYQVFAQWKQGEWHHIALRWSDYDGQIEIWIDGHEVPNTRYRTRLLGDRYEPSFVDPTNGQQYVGYANYLSTVGSPPVATGGPQGVLGQPWTTGANMQDGKLPPFVRLNARTGPTAPPSGFGSQAAWEETLWPKDQVYIGSVRRTQAQSEGLFKYATKPDLPCNGTIDEVRFYDGTAKPTTPGDPQRFEDAGIWTNEFDLASSFPSGINSIELGTLAFTAYLPTRGSSYNSANNAMAPEKWPTGGGRVTVWAEIQDSAGQVLYGSDPTRSPANLVPIDPLKGTGLKADFDNIVLSPSSIRMVDANARPLTLKRGQKVVYLIEMEPALDSRAEVSMSPVIEDVSLTTLLPNPRVLLKRRVDN